MAMQIESWNRQRDLAWLQMGVSAGPCTLHSMYITYLSNSQRINPERFRDRDREIILKVSLQTSIFRTGERND
jgi:hypothetical protein